MTDKETSNNKTQQAHTKSEPMVRSSQEQASRQSTEQQAPKHKEAKTDRTKPQKPVTPKQQGADQSTPSSGKGFAVFALVIAVVALAAVTAFWYEAQQSGNAETMLQQVIVQTQQKHQDMLDSLQADQQQKQAQLSEQIAHSEAVRAALQLQIDLLLNRTQQLEKKFEPERDRFILGRVHELIYQAQSVIVISRQGTGYARDLLVEAQQLLAGIDDPYWDSLRRALVHDIEVLRSAGNVSVAPVFEQIEQIRRNLRSLDFRPQQVEGVQQKESNDDEAVSWMERFAGKLAVQLRKMIVIRQHEDSLGMQLDTDSFHLIKLILESGLSQAQLGLLQRDKGTFVESLNQVREAIAQWLGSYQLDGVVQKLDLVLSTNLFDVPASLESYPVLKSLEAEQQ